MNLGQSERAENYLERASKMLKAFPDQRLEARIICRLGFLNLHNSIYSKAIELFLEADKRMSLIDKKTFLKRLLFYWIDL